MSQSQPHMTTVNGRPTTILPALESSDGVLVQCRMPDGVDTFVPLQAIFDQYIRDLADVFIRSMGEPTDNA